MNQRSSHKALEILAPLFAMATGPDLTKGEMGEAITIQYREVIKRFPAAAAKAGVLRACKGTRFRPAPHEVFEACEVERDALASLVLKGSIKEVPWTEEDEERVQKLTGLARLVYGRRKWCDHFGIDYLDYKACKTDLEKVRLLARWQRIEPTEEASPLQAEARRLAAATELRRIV